MNKNQYINGIIKRIKCGGEKKKEIKKQLLTDINFSLEQGKNLTEIMSQMGTVKEIADGFNENLPETEKKKYTRTRAVKITVIVLLILVLVSAAGFSLIYWFIPKGVDIEQSEYFEKEQVEQAMMKTIELLDSGNYTDLQANAIKEMLPYLKEDAMEKTKAQLSKDWGNRQSVGTIYLAELVQGKIHYAVGEVTVTYENLIVVYRLTYNADMKLAGLYMR